MIKYIIILIMFILTITHLSGSSGCRVDQSRGTVGTLSGFKSPEILSRVEPSYPAYARRKGIEGKVILRFEINNDGSLGEITVVQSVMTGRRGLDQATINAIKKWEFSPAMRHGEPVPSVMILPFVFSLDEK